MEENNNQNNKNKLKANSKILKFRLNGSLTQTPTKSNSKVEISLLNKTNHSAVLARQLARSVSKENTVLTQSKLRSNTSVLRPILSLAAASMSFSKQCRMR